MAYASTNIHPGHHASTSFPPNFSFRFPTIQNDRQIFANANDYNIMTRPIFPRLPYSRPHLPSTSTSPSPIWHSGLSPYHYKLIILPTSVRRCYGCNCAFVDKSRQQPYNTIVKHVDRRIMQKDHGTHSYIYTPDFTNTYYHPISDHIRRKNPLFTGSVCLSSSLYASISALQKQLLENSDLNIQL